MGWVHKGEKSKKQVEENGEVKTEEIGTNSHVIEGGKWAPFQTTSLVTTKLHMEAVILVLYSTSPIIYIRVHTFHSSSIWVLL